jgi:hypothetical protein
MQIARLGFAIAITVLAAHTTILILSVKLAWLLICMFSLGAFIDITSTIAISVFFQKNYNPLLRYNLPNLSSKLGSHGSYVSY